MVRRVSSIGIVFICFLIFPIDLVHATATDKRVVLIIDDFGNRMEGTKEILDLPIPITVAVMPFMPTSHEDAEHAFQKGDDVIVHLPMEPQHKARGLGKGAITTDLSDAEIRKRVLAAIADVPHAIGINNHMGSKATGDSRVMKVILEVCREKNLIFVDSKTNYWSVVPKVAKQLQVPFVENHIFLDDSSNPSKITTQCALIRKHLKHHDLCFAIGHVGRPGKETAFVLRHEVPKIQKEASFTKLSSLFPPPLKQLVNEWQGINCDESVDVFIGSKFGTRHLYGTQRKTVIGRTYFLLNHRQIPAVIVEMGVMSNSKDFLMLKDEKTQERISHVLGTAVKLAGKVNSIRIGA